MSDQVGSEALAAMLHLCTLPSSFVPDAASLVLRRVARDRVSFREQQEAVVNLTYALLLARGSPYEEGLLGLQRRREGLRALHLPDVERGQGRLDDLDPATRHESDSIFSAPGT